MSPPQFSSNDKSKQKGKALSLCDGCVSATPLASVYAQGVCLSLSPFSSNLPLSLLLHTHTCVCVLSFHTKEKTLDTLFLSFAVGFSDSSIILLFGI